MKYLVTGASGHLGQKVVHHLRNHVAEEGIRVGIHNLQKAALFEKTAMEVCHLDYFTPSTIDDCFQGVNVLVYIPSITFDLIKRVQEFENVLAGAQRNHVESFIFVSFFADQVNNPFQMSPFYAYVPRRLAGSGLAYAYVRNTLYADPLIPYLSELIERGHIIYPVADQPLSFISRDDSAKAIASLAVEPALRDHGQSYLLSMSQNYNMVELAKIMTKETGHQITYRPVTVEQFGRIYQDDGGAELASMYDAGQRGLMKATNDDFRRLTGEAPVDMMRFIHDHYND